MRISSPDAHLITAKHMLANETFAMTNRSSADSPAQATKRAYQACTRCRQRKARCLLPDGPPPSPDSPLSCLRCRREHKTCVFAAERTRKSSAHAQSPQPQTRPHTRPQTHRRSSTTARPDQDEERWETRQDNDSNGPQPHQPTFDHHAVAGLGQGASPIDTLPDRVSRAVVSTQTDALNLLFEAAEAYHTTDAAAATAPGGQSTTGGGNSHANIVETPRSHAPVTEHWLHPADDTGSVMSADSNRTFGKLKFVKKRWLSAQEAATYVHLFFKNMTPLTPILTDFYRDPRNFNALVTKEPVLCTVILTLSSRYHLLHGDAWVSRSYFLHNRLWRYCDSLLQRVFWGQEKSLASATRSLGTIEALLLMVEWHARSLHLPPDTEAWDSDDDESDQRDDSTSHVPKRWLEGVVEPMGRSARMSWALIQAAASLSQELGVFDDTKDNSRTPTPPTASHEMVAHRKKRLKALVYVYINQVAFRMGYSALIPNNLVNPPPGLLDLNAECEMSGQWVNLMTMWVDLTSITRTSHDLIFASKTTTREVIHSGRYRRILGHFKPMLDAWWAKYSNLKDKSSLCVFISVDFLFLKVYIFSLALQAAAERKLLQTERSPSSTNIFSAPLGFEYEDYTFIQETIVNANDLLQIIIDFSYTGGLRYAPVRVYVRIISTCIFLLKALALGVPAEQLNSSLSRIDQCAKALRLHIVDDVHLAGIFASLLETYTRGFRVRFVPVPNITALGIPATYHDNDFLQDANADAQADINMGNGLTGEMGMGPDAAPYEWFAHPFEASMAPFGVDFGQPYGVFDGELDFIWTPYKEA